MILHPPLIITPRLLAGVSIGRAFISIALPASRDPSGRLQYTIWIDLPDGSEHEITDLHSGCGGGDIQGGLSAILSFLDAAAESRRYREHTGGSEIDPDSNESLFEPAVVDWAAANADEIGMLSIELGEARGLVED